MTKSPTDRYGNCSICDQPFTNDEWLDRHTSADGGDCHEDCCDVCAMEDAAAPNDVEYINSLPYHTDTIRCPNCESIQNAEVTHTQPWAMFVHDCTECGYTIMESEWEKVADTELVAEAAATVTEANGFDGDDQAAHGCRLRPLAIGCGNGTSWRMWRNAASDPAYVRWVEEDMPMPDCTPFDDESVAGHGWPAECRSGYIGTLDI